MIAIDTSSLRRFLSGETGRDVEAVAAAIESQTAVLPPAVVTEILSDPSSRSIADILTALPVLEPTEGYWQRAGELRARVIAAGFKSRLGDALIAQSCLDHEVALITHDRDFRHYEAQGLLLV